MPLKFPMLKTVSLQKTEQADKRNKERNAIGEREAQPRTQSASQKNPLFALVYRVLRSASFLQT